MKEGSQEGHSQPHQELFNMTSRGPFTSIRAARGRTLSLPQHCSVKGSILGRKDSSVGSTFVTKNYWGLGMYLSGCLADVLGSISSN